MKSFLQHLDSVFGPNEYTFQLLGPSGWGIRGDEVVKDHRSPIFKASAETLGETLREYALDQPNLYIASGLFSEGRRVENCTRALWLVPDLDCSLWLNMPKGKAEAGLHSMSQEDLVQTLRDHHAFVKSRAEKIGLPPSAWVRSGYGHYALYYLEDGFDLKRTNEVSSLLFDRWNADGKVCDATKDAGTRLMRCPGAWNIKNPAIPRKCRFAKGTLKLWTLAEIESICRPLATSQTDSWQARLSRQALRYLQGETPPEGKRNNTLFIVACELQSAGIPQDQAVDLLLPTATKGGTSDSEARSTIRSAYQEEREPARCVGELTEITKLADVSLEMRVIALSLRDADAREIATSKLWASDFRDPVARSVFKVVVELMADNRSIDPMTVHDTLHSRSDETAARMVLDIAKVPADVELLDEWIGTIRCLSTDRQIVQAAAQYMADVQDPHDGSLADEFAGKVTQIMERRIPRSWATIADEAMTEYNAAEEAYAAKATADHTTRIVGVPTGIQQFDDATGGLRQNLLSTILGNPGDGKTSLAIQILWEAATTGHPAGLISIELPKEQIRQSIIATHIPTAAKNVWSANLTTDEWQSFAELTNTFRHVPFYLYDKVNTLDEIKGVIAAGVREHDLQIVAIDYVQLVRSSNPKSDSVRAMEDVMRALQSQAMRLNVHIMLLSQLKREQKDPSRKIKKLRPALDSGKGSSEIEQLSRYILGVYQEPEDMMLNERRAEISVLKAPGPLFDLSCTFDNTRRMFTKFDFAGTVPDNKPDFEEGDGNERWYDR